MLKLLIVDDEPFIRETISSLIDWNSLGIELIGSASDGIEAYNIILDEYPDIVMTDIKMPGLSGLELIEKIHNTNEDTAFIILSGYDDFEYAKEAMKYGVRHYLLKPCRESQIISCIQETMTELARSHALRRARNLSVQFNNDIFLNIFNQCLASDDSTAWHTLFQPYKKYLDFGAVPYELCHLYYTERQALSEALDMIEHFRTSTMPGVTFQYIYVNHTLTLFFESVLTEYGPLDTFLEEISFRSQSVTPVYERSSFSSLEELLSKLLGRIRRYDTICYSSGSTITPLCNYQNIMQTVMRLCTEEQPDKSAVLDSLLELLADISDLNFLRQLASSIFLQYTSGYSSLNTIKTAEFLLEINSITDTDELFQKLVVQLTSLFERIKKAPSDNVHLSRKIKEYVNENLSNPNLSLKWISENYIYMNVDYISKRFYKETGQKFSNYLTEVRIEKAKELLTGSDTAKIQYVAEKIGCGNNPQYFSSLFKRYTGITPSNYVKQIKGGSSNDKRISDQ